MGFGGRVGDRMFASKYEGLISDRLVLDKGLTGRYLPLAITFIPEELFSTFDGLVSGVGANVWSSLHRKCTLLVPTKQAEITLGGKRPKKLRLAQPLGGRGLFSSAE